MKNIPKYNVTKFVYVMFFILFISATYLYGKSINKSYLPDIVKPTPELTPTIKPTSKPDVNITNTITPKVNNIATKQPLPVLTGSIIFNYLNAYRSSMGVPFLSVSNELCSIAENRADYMIANERANFKSSSIGAHTGLGDVSYSGNMLGENLAMNVADDKYTIEFWKTSVAHNNLMLITEKDGFQITKGCIATRVTEDGSIVVLIVGDK